MAKYKKIHPHDWPKFKALIKDRSQLEEAYFSDLSLALNKFFFQTFREKINVRYSGHLTLNLADYLRGPTEACL